MFEYTVTVTKMCDRNENSHTEIYLVQTIVRKKNKSSPVPGNQYYLQAFTSYYDTFKVIVNILKTFLVLSPITHMQFELFSFFFNNRPRLAENFHERFFGLHTNKNQPNKSKPNNTSTKVSAARASNRNCSITELHSHRMRFSRFYINRK